ncbi:MAG: tetratricopeptide repeat protein, partial [Blastocatellia bacterium]|nr:tetratricopeptide repeat protein [Blastocatellia bacterium]
MKVIPLRKALINIFLVCLSVLLICGFQEGTARRYFEQAQEAQRSGDFEKAEKEYLAFLKLVPGSAEAYSNLGVIYSHQSRYDDAVRSYEK